MSKKETIFIHGINTLKVDEKGHLYWNDRPVVTDVKISRWVNIAIIIGAISTAFYAIATVLGYLNIYIN
jgi:hypothetical protein